MKVVFPEPFEIKKQCQFLSQDAPNESNSYPPCPRRPRIPPETSWSGNILVKDIWVWAAGASAMGSVDGLAKGGLVAEDAQGERRGALFFSLGIGRGGLPISAWTAQRGNVIPL